MSAEAQGDLFAQAAPAPTREVASGRLRSMRAFVEVRTPPVAAASAAKTEASSIAAEAAPTGAEARVAAARSEEPVQYELRVGDDVAPLAPLLGKQLAIRWNGRIECAECGNDTPRSYSGGYCYPCSQTLACCDRCIVSPELCHFHLGTCREPEWAQGFCMQPHIVYLANSSGLKVGITREGNLPGRWLDQGATQGVPLLKVQSRFHAGLWEDAIRKHVADRTDWRAMLQGRATEADLQAEGVRLLECVAPAVREQLPPAERLVDAQPRAFDFPSDPRPGKIRALNLDKQSTVDGKLEGIKGQYLLFDTFVFNVRRHSGYDVTVLVQP